MAASVVKQVTPRSKSLATILFDTHKGLCTTVKEFVLFEVLALDKSFATVRYLADERLSPTVYVHVSFQTCYARELPVAPYLWTS